MRIYSKFKDYYDGVQFYGSDPTVVYVRNTEERSHKPGEPLVFGPKTPNIAWRYQDIVSYSSYAIAFCGKTYRFFGFFVKSGYDYEWVYIHNKTQFRKQVVSKLSKDAKRLFTTPILDRWDKSDTRSLAEVFMDAMDTCGVFDEKNYVELHRYYNSPVVLCEGSKVTVNPCLKDYGFASMVDPYTAYQELDMYMSGVLGSNAPKMVQISDKDRIAKHGFNEYSFRHPIKL